MSYFSHNGFIFQFIGYRVKYFISGPTQSRKLLTIIHIDPADWMRLSEAFRASRRTQLAGSFSHSMQRMPFALFSASPCLRWREVLAFAEILYFFKIAKKIKCQSLRQQREKYVPQEHVPTIAKGSGSLFLLKRQHNE
ncbi:hypothetical protein LPB67_03390 [Undibacterium sp. Jales W-56]|uniref:hypothetical protein n=1 Tax=Undibacterium sp. Jales W-56 TaxID=2897325 RepID=UPI0021D32E06|nr:hypothetical protein [Undibacterium sp. Jales W-56]MCU6432821.1 hypothetical protein [Undibacterium sp. Jales W-56]